MVVNYTIGKKTFDVTIELSGITEDAFNDISTYIGMRLNQELSIPVDFICESKKAIDDPSPVKTETEIEKERKVSKQKQENEAYKDFMRMVYEYKESPKRFKLEKMTSAEYLAAHPELSGVSAKAIGRFMISNGMPHEKCSRKSLSGVFGTHNVYSFPVMKRTFGTALKEARFESKLSLGEVSQLIGYPKENIKRWEMDEYTPSSEAVEELKKLFGNDAFANLDE